MKHKKKGLFILTGSHKVDLHHAISQSLAGRTALLKLLPMSLEELRHNKQEQPLDEIILNGGYPRIYKDNLPLDLTYSSYFQTYVERDIRHIIKIKDILPFEKFVKLLASRVGQIINYSSLACDVGVSSVVTIKEWISVLEASYLIFKLEHYFDNFGKRLIKSPKIYFCDTGLLCYLMGIENTEQLRDDPVYGTIFENFTILELLKQSYNQAKEPHFYFYRDTSGKEIDLIKQQGSFLVPVEIKSSKTFSSGFLQGLDYFHSISQNKAKGGYIIYNGDTSQKIRNYELVPINSCHQMF